MGSRWSGRTRDAERIAGQAWDELVSTLESGGDTAKSFARRTGRKGRRAATDLADDAGDRLRPALKESRRRAGAAMEALSGKRPPIQWELIMAGVIGGVVAGWVAGALNYRAAEEQFIKDESVLLNEAPLPADQEPSLP
jgi:hypothetical protein